MKNLGLASIIVAVVASQALTFQAQATPAFARKEKKTCGYCHLRMEGGGKRGFRGKFYDAHGMSFKGFVEKKEAKLAGVKPDAMGPATKPTKTYPPVTAPKGKKA